ncbi:ABC transporter permease [Asticcacaulis sp. BYS171W]|uniref:ABC transporter permease n=1 Tax=Asticcacaulis aquaticus TaxID=2984212 RepID=A0ABT5HS31_9CAUL|nr:ABC transporter permease [Asticcacaulis aquaticus]MDC7682876.1 ABC transporter permease [Asticcacaulis aquaticus]
MFTKAINDFRGGIKLSHVWSYQAYHEVSAKYKRTIFGSLWIVGSMVFLSVAFAIVSSAIFHQDVKQILPYIMGGLTAFTLISFILTEAPELFMSNSGIISNHAYPFSYYILEAVLKCFIVFAHNIIVFEIIQALCTGLPVPHWSILIALPLVYVNMLTWGTLVAMISARYRDMRYLLPYLNTVVMFMTPLMFRADSISPSKRLLIDLNPFYPFIEMLRSPLMGQPMALQYWYSAAGITVLGILVWLIFFNAFRNRIAFWI